MELPAGVLRWLGCEAKRRGMTLEALVVELARLERDGGAVLDVDVIRREDGKVRMEVFPDKGSGIGEDEKEALASLRECLAKNRVDWREWRMRRAMSGTVGKVETGGYVTYRARVEFDRVRINGLPGQLGKWAEYSRLGRATRR